MPENEIGDVFTNPNQCPILEGPANLEIVFKRANVQPMAGTITIYNGDGEGTSIRILPTKDFEAGKNYSVSVSEGAFTAADGFTPNKPGQTNWVVSAELKDGNIISFLETPAVTE